MDTDVEDWLQAWERAVRARDHAAGRALFAPEVLAFGTLAPVMAGLDALEAAQWRTVWARTQGFACDRPVALWQGGDVVVLAATWSATGLDPAGAAYPRAGRMTLVLRRGPRGLLCCHSHLSMLPGMPAMR